MESEPVDKDGLCQRYQWTHEIPENLTVGSQKSVHQGRQEHPGKYTMLVSQHSGEDCSIALLRARLRARVFGSGWNFLLTKLHATESGMGFICKKQNPLWLF